MRSLRQLKAAINRAAGGELSEDQQDKVVALINRILQKDILGLHEFAERLGITQQAANNRVLRGLLPRPAGRTRNGRYWPRWVVEDHIRENPSAVRQNKPEVMSDAG